MKTKIIFHSLLYMYQQRTLHSKKKKKKKQYFYILFFIFQFIKIWIRNALYKIKILNSKIIIIASFKWSTQVDLKKMLNGGGGGDSVLL